MEERSEKNDEGSRFNSGLGRRGYKVERTEASGGWGELDSLGTI
jgi:hypothetical protein